MNWGGTQQKEGAVAIAPAQPVAWGLLALPAVAQLLLHLFTNGRSGIFRDEYYYLACAARPAWGYVDQPPLSIWILAAWTSVFGDSVHALRVLPALCGAAMVLLAGATAAELGGRRPAQLLAGLGVGIGGSTLVVTGFYSMNCFDLLFWLGAYFVLIRLARTQDGAWWLPFGLVVGLGLFNKIGLLVLGASLAVALVATPLRRHLRDRRLYLGAALALLFLVPYALWNATHGWATLEFIENATAGKNARFTPLAFLRENVLGANPLTVPLWAAGLGWLLLARRARPFRFVAVLVLATFVLLNVQQSKPYYFATSPPVLIAAGAVAWEHWTSARPWAFARWVLLALLVLGGVAIAPMVVPVLSPAGTLAYFQRAGIMPAAEEQGHTSELPQYIADRLGWEELARVVSEVYLGLPEEDRGRCVAIGRNYGHAGALEYWSRKYPLPPVFSRHNNYWFWGPPPADADIAIVVRGDPAELQAIFAEFAPAGVASTPGAVESSMRIWLCRGPRLPVAELWAQHRTFD